MDKRWVLKEKADNEVVADLAMALNINKRLGNLLIQRNIETFDEAKKFFRPNLKDLHDPLLMKDMDKAVERVFQATESGEKIMIYGVLKLLQQSDRMYNLYYLTCFIIMYKIT